MREVLCTLCEGVACERCCGIYGHGCTKAHAGPASHRVCHHCGGSGREPKEVLAGESLSPTSEHRCGPSPAQTMDAAIRGEDSMPTTREWPPSRRTGVTFEPGRCAPMGEPTVLPVLSLHQPYPALIVAGAKRWETRPGPPSGDMCPPGVRPLPGRRINRGDRIGIASSARKPSPTAPDVGGWWWQAGSLVTVGPTRMLPAPLGHLVATATVADAVPITTPAATVPRRWMPHIAPPLLQPNELRWFQGEDTYAPTPRWESVSITDQLPFGDWRPGRWAWLLEDVAPTTERCPWCWGDCYVPAESERDLLHPDARGLHGEPLAPCPVCLGSDGVCDPIPVKGKQGVWAWHGEVHTDG